MVVAALVLGTALWVITPAPAHAAGLGLGWAPSWEGAWSWLVRFVAHWDKEGSAINPNGSLAKEGSMINPDGLTTPAPPTAGTATTEEGGAINPNGVW